MRIAVLAWAIPLAAMAQTPSFHYTRAKALDVRVTGTEMRGDVRIVARNREKWLREALKLQ
jgi:hypothetical protein